MNGEITKRSSKIVIVFNSQTNAYKNYLTNQKVMVDHKLKISQEDFIKNIIPSIEKYFDENKEENTINCKNSKIFTSKGIYLYLEPFNTTCGFILPKSKNTNSLAYKYTICFLDDFRTSQIIIDFSSIEYIVKKSVSECEVTWIFQESYNCNEKMMVNGLRNKTKNKSSKIEFIVEKITIGNQNFSTSVCNELTQVEKNELKWASKVINDKELAKSIYSCKFMKNDEWLKKNNIKKDDDLKSLKIFLNSYFIEVNYDTNDSISSDNNNSHIINRQIKGNTINTDVCNFDNENRKLAHNKNAKLKCVENSDHYTSHRNNENTIFYMDSQNSKEIPRSRRNDHGNAFKSENNTEQILDIQISHTLENTLSFAADINELNAEEANIHNGFNNENDSNSQKTLNVEPTKPYVSIRLLLDSIPDFKNELYKHYLKMLERCKKQNNGADLVMNPWHCSHVLYNRVFEVFKNDLTELIFASEEMNQKQNLLNKKSETYFEKDTEDDIINIDTKSNLAVEKDQNVSENIGNKKTCSPTNAKKIIKIIRKQLDHQKKLEFTTTNYELYHDKHQKMCLNKEENYNDKTNKSTQKISNISNYYTESTMKSNQSNSFLQNNNKLQIPFDLSDSLKLNKNETNKSTKKKKNKNKKENFTEKTNQHAKEKFDITEINTPKKRNWPKDDEQLIFDVETQPSFEDNDLDVKFSKNFFFSCFERFCAFLNGIICKFTLV
ncbi:hypothetical protein EDEG_03170 [Edhazardia aedis USNM 41457]|uniref:Uncharacterized protein n=1 Tax=Edhazardia aedis (strain USNM 41457) TaxID=1003232 RepID=J9D3I1_EDHAE|nr:hypothetical protein EDEG_03170 [Edhazardia aedis USNM 41457]|eukprot:EJW02401.1 hypothetical protein EDEG_03170 [Edhazardia aedis USNM 41457]